ncbi:AraC family transcriptional regulator [Nocardia sp. NPDC050712]|uniref:AraC family transcriptional regulator n=1 Tax=Nocardia sp. NPDC050712 TaxID=3155518 RepID=UPI0033DF4BC8
MAEIVVGGPEISTAGTSGREAFDYWNSMVSRSVVPCAIEPERESQFHGRIVPRVSWEPLTISLSMHSAQFARRSRRHIDTSAAPYTVAGIPLSGPMDVRSGDVCLRVPVGALLIADATRPLDFRTADYTGILIRVPRARLLQVSGLAEDEMPSATVLEPIGHGTLVIDYFRSLADSAPEVLGAEPMLSAGLDLLGAGLAVENGHRPGESACVAVGREHVLRFLRDNLADPRLNVDRVAAGCAISRRKLFRLLGEHEGGPMALLRSLRIDRARELLVTAPDQTILAIAEACGFSGDRQFYRVFREQTGMSPAEYRENGVSWIEK